LDIFISYSRQNQQASECICTLLRREGYTVAIDRDFLVAGDEYRAQIEKELLAAKVVLVLWSVDSVQSSFVRDEASRAARRTVLLQLIIDEMPDSAVPLGFGELQRLRCSWTQEGRLSDDSRQALLVALERHVPAVEPLDAAINQLRHEVDQRLGAECEVQEWIGTGRTSVVFKAQHSEWGLVALKVTPLASVLLLPGFYAEFRGCLEAARVLSHPNISSVRAVKLLETIACTISDYVEGDALARCIARASPCLHLGCIKDIASGVAEGLAHAHQHRIMHCRLSPSNILIERSQDRALVCDFGMPRVGGGPEAAATRALFLDARYISPEQCLGQPASPHSDQYALGAILYEMLTGRPPFVGNSSFVIMRGHCQEVPPPIAEFRPHCPPKVAASVLRMLAKKPKDRFLTTAMLATEIAAWPLAESVTICNQVRVGAEVTDAGRAAKRALESYTRCLTVPDFLAIFYSRLQENAALAEKFEGVNFDSQTAALKRAIRHLLEYARGQEGARAEIERIAAGHQRLALEAHQIRGFVHTLIDVVLEHDPGVEPWQRAALRDAWREATREGLDRFIELACVALPRQSTAVQKGDAPVNAPRRRARARPAAGG
jgi:Protein kinase domain/TIR domain